MKHYKEVLVPAKVEQHLAYTTCDLCGKQIRRQGYDIGEVAVSYRSGKAYPDCSFGEIVSVDMCSDCFTEKLVPWLESQGAKPVATEFDY